MHSRQALTRPLRRARYLERLHPGSHATHQVIRQHATVESIHPLKHSTRLRTRSTLRIGTLSWSLYPGGFSTVKARTKTHKDTDNLSCHGMNHKHLN
jgi:hypothetical protein